VDEEFRPVFQSVVHLLQSFGIVLRQLYPFPQLGWRVSALDRLHVEVKGSGVGVCADGSIAGICKGTGLSVAEASNIVFVSTKVLFLRGSVMR